MLKKLLSFLLIGVAAINLAFAAVNINTASETDLEKLPGIGPAKAKAIVEYRKKNGPFKSAEDIKHVNGIGDKTYEALKSQISVESAASSAMTTGKEKMNPSKMGKNPAPGANY